MSRLADPIMSTKKQSGVDRYSQLNQLYELALQDRPRVERCGEASFYKQHEVVHFRVNCVAELGGAAVRLSPTDKFSLSFFIAGGIHNPHFMLELRHQTGDVGNRATRQLSKIVWSVWQDYGTDCPRPTTPRLGVPTTFSNSLKNVTFSERRERPGWVQAFFDAQGWRDTDSELPKEVEWRWLKLPTRVNSFLDRTGMDAEDHQFLRP